jgi:hypothetical protein
MNEFHLSGQEISEKYGHCSSLTDLIREIEIQSKVESSVLCEIRVDGLLFLEEDESRFAGTSVSEIKQLDYKTQNVEQLVVDSIKSVLVYLSKLTETAIITSEKLRVGNWEEAYANLNSIVSGTEWVVDMLRQIRVVDGRASQLDLDWKELDADFLSTTKGLLDAFEKSDYVLVADLLEYDWSASLEKWLSLVNRLASLHTEENGAKRSESPHSPESELK